MSKPNFNDIFKPEDEKALQEASRQTDNSLASLGDIARKCLSTEDFKSYRDQYAKTEARVVQTMIMYTNMFYKDSSMDITKYAMTISRYLTKLQDLRSLLGIVEKNSKKGLTDEKSKG